MARSGTAPGQRQDRPLPCDRTTTAGDVDHIRPLSRGGLHEVANLVLACIHCIHCIHCNRSKNNCLLTRWRPDECCVPAACRRRSRPSTNVRSPRRRDSSLPWPMRLA
ncbi:HNH endonuclease [Streptomyces sp. NPDC087845]|uniref:HNH endonuclease n=1 Tax=Streptomyces sp. NPDC087845 TaxID=3365806 RepID=UPI0038264356